MFIRYARLTDAELESMLDALVSQMSSGVASITYNGQAITYSSIGNIMTAVEGIEREITRRLGVANGLTKRTGPYYPRMPGKGF